VDINTLLPRRREIVEIIRDQRLVSLDFLHRRFMGVSTRMLSYDLNCLIKDEYVIKVGKTRGALYAPKEPSLKP